MEITREELLEFGKMATFHLDDRLVPYDRETLRAESWVSGYEFAHRHKREADDLPKEAPCGFREPNCGDMVLIYNNLNKSLPPVLAYWYERKDGNCCFINLNKEDIMYSSENISIEYVSPEEIANIVKLYLQHANEVTLEGALENLKEAVNNSLFCVGDRIRVCKNHEITATVVSVDDQGCAYKLDSGGVVPFERQVLWEKVED